jgi:hypothetical protein
MWRQACTRICTRSCCLLWQQHLRRTWAVMEGDEVSANSGRCGRRLRQRPQRDMDESRRDRVVLAQPDADVVDADAEYSHDRNDQDGNLHALDHRNGPEPLAHDDGHSADPPAVAVPARCDLEKASKDPVAETGTRTSSSRAMGRAHGSMDQKRPTRRGTELTHPTGRRSDRAAYRGGSGNRGSRLDLESEPHRARCAQLPLHRSERQDSRPGFEPVRRHPVPYSRAYSHLLLLRLYRGPAPPGLRRKLCLENSPGVS